MFFKIGAFKNFTIFTGKDLRRNLFLRTTFFIELLWWLLQEKLTIEMTGTQ